MYSALVCFAIFARSAWQDLLLPIAEYCMKYACPTVLGLAVNGVLAALPFASALPWQDCCPDCLGDGLRLRQSSIAHIATRQLLADLHAQHHNQMGTYKLQNWQYMQIPVPILGENP